MVKKSTVTPLWPLLILFFSSLQLLELNGGAQQADTVASPKREITVADGVKTSIVQVHSDVGSLNGDPAWFSPDGKHFIVLLKKGNMARDTNDESILLYRTADAMQAPQPVILATMSSSSNRNAIGGLKWITNETIAFLGDKPSKLTQLYTLNINTKRIDQLTNESKDISAFDVSRDSTEIIYATALPLKTGLDEEQKREGFVHVTDQRLGLLERGDYANQSFDSQIYSKKRGHSPRPVRRYFLHGDNVLSLSPNGRYALVFTILHGYDLKREWSEYHFDDDLRRVFESSIGGSAVTPFEEYELVDLQSGLSRPLLDTPFFLHGKIPVVAWKPNGRSVVVEDQYLPLNVSDPKEREARRTTRYDVEVSIPDRTFRVLSKGELNPESREHLPINVTLEQDVNTPPTVKITDLRSHQQTELLDPNPQFKTLSFGHVETIRWKVAGDYTVGGGLYLPPDYKIGRRYPLVIQTHGYRPEGFTMDGKLDWNSGYAARALAAKGVIVLQMYYFPDETVENDSDRIVKDKRFGENSTQAWKQFEARAHEGAIDYLNQRGIVDRDRVGIMGFSRTVSYIGYALTHTKYHFAAALAVDGIDASYFSYIAYAGTGILSADSEALNGGGPPWGDSFTGWRLESPGFNLDKIRTPIRLESHARLLGDDPGGGVMSQWEWFIGLSRLNKPVDFIVLPDASHMVAMPNERIVSQQGAVDWFRFWLQGYERPNPEDPDQYVLWRHLRELRDADIKATETQPSSPTVH